MNAASGGSRNQVLGIILVALGVLFFVGQFADFGSVAWPFFIIAPGLGLLVWALVGGRGAAGLAIPGSIVTTIGLILFTQNLFGRFESWAYAWALLIAAGGFGTFLMGVLTDHSANKDRGWNSMLAGLGLFVVFGAFFELFIFNQSILGNYLVPVALIAAGIWLIARQQSQKSSSIPPSDSQLQEKK
ncbi:MAG: hypothetical protein SFU83_04795 [Meiothermus sp.]|nr:hypothetical protein [Meiothermus sp.]